MDNALYVFDGNLIDNDLLWKPETQYPICVAKFTYDGIWKTEYNVVISEREERDLKSNGCYGYNSYDASVSIELDWNGLLCNVDARSGKSIKIKTRNPKTAKVKLFVLPKRFTNPILEFGEASTSPEARARSATASLEFVP